MSELTATTVSFSPRPPFMGLFLSDCHKSERLADIRHFTQAITGMDIVSLAGM